MKVMLSLELDDVAFIGEENGDSWVFGIKKGDGTSSDVKFSKTFKVTVLEEKEGE